MSAVPPRQPQPSGWAMGGVTFAASMLGLIGIFQIIAGLTAIFNDDFFVVARNYTFDLDVSAWGWITLIWAACSSSPGSPCAADVRRPGVGRGGEAPVGGDDRPAGGALDGGRTLRRSWPRS